MNRFSQNKAENLKLCHSWSEWLYDSIESPYNLYQYDTRTIQYTRSSLSNNRSTAGTLIRQGFYSITFLLMSIISFVRRLFGTQTIPPIIIKDSELSNPRVNFRARNPRTRKYDESHRRVLQELADLGIPVTSHDFIRCSYVYSADRRLNDCYHLGYVDIQEVAHTQGKKFIYFLNEEWKKKIWEPI